MSSKSLIEKEEYFLRHEDGQVNKKFGGGTEMSATVGSYVVMEEDVNDALAEVVGNINLGHKTNPLQNFSLYVYNLINDVSDNVGWATLNGAEIIYRASIWQGDSVLWEEERICWDLEAGEEGESVYVGWRLSESAEDYRVYSVTDQKCSLMADISRNVYEGYIKMLHGTQCFYSPADWTKLEKVMSLGSNVESPLKQIFGFQDTPTSKEARKNSKLSRKIKRTIKTGQGEGIRRLNRYERRYKRPRPGLGANDSLGIEEVQKIVEYVSDAAEGIFNQKFVNRGSVGYYQAIFCAVAIREQRKPELYPDKEEDYRFRQITANDNVYMTAMVILVLLCKGYTNDLEVADWTDNVLYNAKRVYWDISPRYHQHIMSKDVTNLAGSRSLAEAAANRRLQESDLGSYGWGALVLSSHIWRSGYRDYSMHSIGTNSVNGTALMVRNQIKPALKLIRDIVDGKGLMGFDMSKEELDKVMLGYCGKSYKDAYLNWSENNLR